MHPAIPLIVLGALPWIMLSISTDWIYSAAGLIDSWLYHGFFHMLPEFASGKFGLTYYASRLAWILPGFAAYQVLPPHAANLLLHVLFFYAAIFALYRATAILSSRSAALVASVAFATTTPTIVAFGWDYVDGAVITYTLVAMWAIIEASVARRRMLLIGIGGAAGACIVHSNLAAALIGPALLIAYWCTHRDKRWLDLAAFVGGGVAVTLLMGLCNSMAGGPFLFFMSSVRWASGSVGTQTFDPVSPLKWPGSARFIVPLVGLSAAIGAFGARRNAATRIGLFSLLSLVTGFIAYDWGTTGGMLQTQYYVSWFLPLAFIGVAVAFGSLSTRFTLWSVVFIASAQLTALRLAPNRLHRLLVETYAEKTAALECTIAIAALVLAAVVCWRGRPALRAAVLAVVVVVTDFVAAPNLGFALTMDGRTQFELVQQTLALIRGRVPPGSLPVFWIQAGTRNSQYISSVVSTYLYLYSIVSFSYPDFDDPTGKYPKPGTSLNAGDYLLLLTDAAAERDRVRQEVRDMGLEAEIVSSAEIRADDARFVITLLRATY